MSSSFEALTGHRMDEQAVDAFLRDSGVGVLSMAAGDAGYGIPLSFGYDGDRLYFLFVGHSEEWKKVTFAERSETASFLAFDVDPDGAWQSVVVEGSLERITPEEWDGAREAMADNAYRPDLLTDVDPRENPRVWTLDPREQSGRTVGPE
jgi:nitroimidazol reductase NimA-like FMN-containing flavoprotein (pyridoxamine 5'-phosphate oxidase superfamily)